MLPKGLSSAFAVALACLFFVSVSAASECRESIGGCGYYACMNEKMSCDSQQYFEQFAKPYCDKFDAHQSRFSENGRATLQTIKTCLQNQVESDSGLTCENALERAYGEHRECYLASGFCTLSVHDKLAILDLVYPELRHRGFRKAMLQTVEGCFRQGELLDQSEVRLLNNSILLRE